MAWSTNAHGEREGVLKMGWIPKLLLETDCSKLVSLKEYERIAEKQIRYFRQYFVFKQVMVSDELVGLIVQYLIRADSKFEEGLGRTKWSLRNHYARFAITRYFGEIERKRKLKKNTWQLRENNYIQSLEHEYVTKKGTRLLKDLIAAKQGRDAEQKEAVLELSSIMDNSGITTLQRKYIVLYYLEDMNFREIAEKFSQTKQGVQQVIFRGIEKMKEYVINKENAV